MFNFWENIARYPRFFISAMLGLALIITKPFQRLQQNNIGKFIFISIFILLILAFVFIFKNMLDL